MSLLSPVAVVGYVWLEGLSERGWLLKGARRPKVGDEQKGTRGVGLILDTRHGSESGVV